LLWQFRVRRTKPSSTSTSSTPIPPSFDVRHSTFGIPLTLRADVLRALELLPYGFLLLALIIAALALPLDLAGVEPFAAYVIRSAGIATLVIALVGLAASWFVPQAYCRFGCPTGALLNFVRARGATDRFGARDAAALAFVALAAALNYFYLPLIHWVKSV
jgi:hypothetical protein